MSSAAVAEILKGSCGGCHTSLSVKEQAEMKKIADTPDAVCPYCGCLLAV
jgi:predicted  nucleic acid-binding Zn-ribbon protein